MRFSKIINLILILVIVLFDQLTKTWAQTSLSKTEGLILIPDLLELSYKENTGIAFSMFSAYPQLLTILISLVILVLLYIQVRSLEPSWGLACILGGGLGNLIDRFFRGYVVDFINPIFVDFAVFNVADVFLNIGVALIIFEQLYSNKRTKA